MILSVWVLFFRWKMVSPKSKNLALAFLSLHRASQRRRTLAQPMPNIRRISKLDSRCDFEV
jgi:hypothetical protein